MLKIVFVGGYARSGKSTLMKYLATKNCHCFSTSQYLDSVCEKELGEYWTDAFVTKDTLKEKELVALTGKNYRTYKINKAEKELVPKLGRLRALVIPVLTPLLKLSNSDFVAIETIGGKEFELMLDWIKNNVKSCQISLINCRSPFELKGVDIRELLPTDKEKQFSKNPDYHLTYANLFLSQS